jgi:hypothetical protein
MRSFPWTGIDPDSRRATLQKTAKMGGILASARAWKIFRRQSFAQSMFKTIAEIAPYLYY